MNNIHGLIIVITGNGKGKTTSSIGGIIRALNYNWKVALFQFMKGKNCTGEINFLKQHIDKNYLSIQKFNIINDFIDNKEIEIDEKYIKRILKKIKKVILDENTKLIVLDEINIVLFKKYIKTERIIELLKIKPKWKTIMLTGRYADNKIIEIADLVSEIKEIKHPFNIGIKSQKGIEY